MIKIELSVYYKNVRYYAGTEIPAPAGETWIPEIAADLYRRLADKLTEDGAVCAGETSCSTPG